MKKYIMVAILLFSIPLYAQGEADSDLSLGVKGGISFNHFLGDIPVDLTPQLKFGFSAGVFANYKLNDNFSIQSEILFSRRGSNFEEFNFSNDEIVFAGLSIDAYVETNWIEIPVLGIYHINEDISLFGGPYIGFYLNGQAVIEPSIANLLQFDLEWDIDAEDLTLPDYGIVLGAKYNLTEKFAVQGRWEYGFQDLTDELFDLFEDELITVNNSSFQLQLDFTI